jgi:hypothetical protein
LYCDAVAAAATKGNQQGAADRGVDLGAAGRAAGNEEALLLLKKHRSAPEAVAEEAADLKVEFEACLCHWAHLREGSHAFQTGTPA